MKFIKKNSKLILVLITIIMLLIRLVYIKAKAGDYLGFLNPWVIQIRNLGHFRALKYNIGNYNVPYMLFLTLFSYFKGEPLYLIKGLSIFFDVICAIFGYKITKLLTKNKVKSIVTYASVLIIPTVIINGTIWGQCDSIYTAFTLISLYYLLKKKYSISFIFLGISIAFKLQGIFILPLYVILFFREKKIHIYHFLLIPLANLILCSPALIAGRSFKDVISIYLNQAGEYSSLSLNFPNFYQLIENNINLSIKYGSIISKIGILLTMFIFALILLYILIKKVKFNPEKIILVGLWSIVIATFFLPHMHERYMFAADVLSIIYCIIYEKRIYLPFVIIISFLAYMKVLFGYDFINLSIIGFIYGIFVIIFTMDLMKYLGEKNEK